MVFKSKVGPEILIPILVVQGAVTLLFLSEGLWVVAGLLAVLTFFLVYLLSSIRYVIQDGKLVILGGFFYRREIEIGAITKVSKSSNPLSSPAASLDRLVIRYGKSKSILVSPKDKASFAETLLKVNPSIELRL